MSALRTWLRYPLNGDSDEHRANSERCGKETSRVASKRLFRRSMHGPLCHTKIRIQFQALKPPSFLATAQRSHIRSQAQETKRRTDGNSYRHVSGAILVRSLTTLWHIPVCLSRAPLFRKQTIHYLLIFHHANIYSICVARKSRDPRFGMETLERRNQLYAGHVSTHQPAKSMPLQ
jgi:hypothetical protein